MNCKLNCCVFDLAVERQERQSSSCATGESRFFRRGQAIRFPTGLAPNDAF